MKYIVEVSIPHEPFNTFVREGTAGQKIGETIDAIGPEAFYFTDKGQGRGAIMIVNIDDGSQIPHVAEPWFLTFDASVNWHIAMLPQELREAGLEKYATN